VIYSRNSVKASNRSNKIAVHSERLKILITVDQLSNSLKIKGPRITKEDVDIFEATVLLSELYFDKNICRDLHQVLGQANELVATSIEWSNRDRTQPDSSYQLHADRYSLCHNIQNKCIDIANNMKKIMRLTEQPD